MNLQQTIRRILKEETQDDNLKDLYEKVGIVDEFMKTFYPELNNRDVEIVEHDDGYKMTFIGEDDKITGGFYAQYYPLIYELILNPELYKSLRKYLGENLMEYIIEWFNNEFGLKAEYITYSYTY
jgi:hypothetical protein